MARTKNPLHKIVSLNSDSVKALDYLLDKAPEEEIIESIREIRKQRLQNAPQKDEIPPMVTKIQKLLVEFPGFQKQTFETLSTAIRSAEQMGVLDRYKAKAAVSTKE